MHPIICTIGPLTIYSYGLALVIAFLVASHLAARQARVWAIDHEMIFNLCFGSFLAGIIGARVLFVLSHWAYYVSNPAEVIMFAQGGLSIFGGLIAGIAYAVRFMRRKRLRAAGVLDLLLPFVALGQAIGRIGCFLNGCCYGREAWWGVTFPGEPGARIPTQLLSSLLLTVLFVVLRILQDRPHAAGSITCWYLILYGLKRFIVESMRADNPQIIGGLTLYHVMSVVFVVAGIAGLVWFKTRTNHQEQSTKDKERKNNK